MKNREISIREFKHPNGSYCIMLSNAGLQQDTIDKVKRIIMRFAKGNELFFGHYKFDGIHITHEEFLKYSLEIPDYFRANGKYQQLVKPQYNKKMIFSNQELIVCSAPNDSETYEIMDKVFHFYLETIIFCPKIRWETFIDSYSNYMNEVTWDYVLKGYTDFLFSYTDSGDFSVSFDPTIYNPQMVKEQINQIMLHDLEN